MRLTPWVGLLSALLWVSSTSIVHAGNNVWTNLGPAGGIVYALVIDPTTPTTLYAGTLGGGVFKSTSGGSSWNAVNAGLTNPLVFTLAIDPTTPTTLYAGTTGNGVFKSTDGGSSWSVVNAGLANLAVRSLAMDPTTPTTLYAGTEAGVFKSASGGSSWSALNTGLANPFVLVLALSPTTPATLYAGTAGDGVFAITFTPPTPGTCSVFPLVGVLQTPPFTFALILQNYTGSPQTFSVNAFIDSIVLRVRTITLAADAFVGLSPSDILVFPGELADLYVCWGSSPLAALGPPAALVLLLSEGHFVVEPPAVRFILP